MPSKKNDRLVHRLGVEQKLPNRRRNRPTLPSGDCGLRATLGASDASRDRGLSDLLAIANASHTCTNILERFLQQRDREQCGERRLPQGSQDRALLALVHVDGTSPAGHGERLPDAEEQRERRSAEGRRGPAEALDGERRVDGPAEMLGRSVASVIRRRSGNSGQLGRTCTFSDPAPWRTVPRASSHWSSGNVCVSRGRTSTAPLWSSVSAGLNV